MRPTVLSPSKGTDLTTPTSKPLTAQRERFFGLSEKEKREASISGVGGNFGYTPFGQEHAKDDARADLKEFYHFAQTKYDQPDCPAVPEFIADGRSLYANLEALAARLLEAVALSLDLDRHYFEGFVQGGNSILRVLHYPPAPDAPEDAPRAGSHEDINLITLLVGSSADGLEVLDKGGDWIPVRAHAQNLTVNVGDMLQNLTGGVLRSTTHRVVLPPGPQRNQSRYSLPFFLHPVGPMPLESHHGRPRHLSCMDSGRVSGPPPPGNRFEIGLHHRSSQGLASLIHALRPAGPCCVVH